MSSVIQQIIENLKSKLWPSPYASLANMTRNSFVIFEFDSMIRQDYVGKW